MSFKTRLFQAGFSVIAVLYNAKAENNDNFRQVRFDVEENKQISLSSDYITVHSESVTHCSLQCFVTSQCCSANYRQQDSNCLLDLSENCCPVIVPVVGQSVVLASQYFPATCIGCVTFGSSAYKIDESAVSWQEAVDKCKCVGGKLCEIETIEENNFIKNELINRNSAALGYWLGGYNYNNDIDLEWISNPNEVMPYTDMESGEPNQPLSQLCLTSWKSYTYQWGSYICSSQLSFVCEFQTQ